MFPKWFVTFCCISVPGTGWEVIIHFWSMHNWEYLSACAAVGFKKCIICVLHCFRIMRLIVPLNVFIYSITGYSWAKGFVMSCFVVIDCIWWAYSVISNINSGLFKMELSYSAFFVAGTHTVLTFVRNMGYIEISKRIVVVIFVNIVCWNLSLLSNGHANKTNCWLEVTRRVRLIADIDYLDVLVTTLVIVLVLVSFCIKLTWRWYVTMPTASYDLIRKDSNDDADVAATTGVGCQWR